MINFEKQLEKVSLVLEKRNINNILCQVKLIIDKSGSMDYLYRNHTVQKVVERILAISMRVDKDGTVDVWAFNNDSKKVKSVTKDNIENYVDNEITHKIPFGGTSYAPPMEDVISDYKPSKGLFGFGSKKAETTFVVFVTDGDADDNYKAEKLLSSSQEYDIYWQFVGIGNGTSFKFLNEMGDKYPNCGFIPIRDIENISDEDLYSGLINDEFAEWIRKFQ